MTANPQRAKRAEAEFPDVRVESDAGAVWERAGAHDVVVIATPNATHRELALRAIELGLAVVVDKPLAPSSEAGREIVEAAERAGVALSVFQSRRWDSDQLTLRRLLADGSLGEVRRYESRFERWRPEVDRDRWRESPFREGGGVLLDLGTHLVDQALTLFGPVAGVYGEVEARRGGPADDDVFLALTHESGVRSHLWASAVAASPGPRLRVLGSEAAFVVEELDGQEEALRAGKRPGDAESWGVEPEARWGRLVRGDHSEPVPAEPGAWPRFYEQVAAALRDGEPVPVDPADAVRTLEILERAVAASAGRD